MVVVALSLSSAIIRHVRWETTTLEEMRGEGVIGGRTRRAVAVVLVGTSLAVYALRQPHVRTAESIAGLVSAHYGDTHPRIVRVVSTQTDNPPHDPMYSIILSGHFHKGPQLVHYIIFSALADKTYVWGVRGYNRFDVTLWFDDELEPLPT